MEKKYFWLKLPEDFFQSKQIKKLRRIAGGDTYTIIYLKMLLKSLRDEGKLYYEGVESDFADEIALDIDEAPEDVKVTINFLLRAGLMSSTESEAMMEQLPQMIGSETGAAARMRRKRNNVTQERNIVRDCYTEIEIDKEIDTDKEKETEIDQEKDKELAQSSAEPSPKKAKRKSQKTVHVGDPVFTLTLNTGEEYPFYQDDLDDYQKTYPAVDVPQQFREMKRWCKDNPTRRKTASGMRRFVNHWLSGEQDKYHTAQDKASGNRFANRPNEVDSWEIH